LDARMDFNDDDVKCTMAFPEFDCNSWTNITMVTQALYHNKK
jgi:hypothetical protein